MDTFYPYLRVRSIQVDKKYLSFIAKAKSGTVLSDNIDKAIELLKDGKTTEAVQVYNQGIPKN